MRRPSSLFPIAFALGAHLVYGRALIAAGVMGLAYATANAQGTAGPPPVISPDVATLVGTVSVTELSASQANRQALQAQKNAQPVEMPKHRRPDGSPMGAPRSETLKALPLTPAPNAGVEGRALRPLQQSVSIIDGFTGIVTGDNARVNGFELEPPDQGLAVHDNVVAEINNLLVQFFKSDGTPLTNPIAASAFFLADDAFLTDTQAFFDSRSQRWFFDIVVSQGSFQGFGLAVSKTSDHWESILSTTSGPLATIYRAAAVWIASLTTRRQVTMPTPFSSRPICSE